MTAWHAIGLTEEKFPAIARRYDGRQCLILGGGRCVWDDCESLGEMPPDRTAGFQIMAVNDIVMYWPGPVEHLYSNDWRWLPKWATTRRPRYVIDYGKARHTHSCNEGARYMWPWPGHGTSALNAVYTALALGYERIVLAGVPLDNSGHFFDPPWVSSKFSGEVPRDDQGGLRFWSAAAEKLFDGRVVSCSGRTRNLLGGP